MIEKIENIGRKGIEKRKKNLVLKSERKWFLEEKELLEKGMRKKLYSFPFFSFSFLSCS